MPKYKAAGHSGPTNSYGNRSPSSWYRWSIDFARWPAQEAPELFSEPGKTLMLCIVYIAGHLGPCQQEMKVVC